MELALRVDEVVEATCKRARTLGIGEARGVVFEVYRWLDSIPEELGNGAEKDPGLTSASTWLDSLRERSLATLKDSGVNGRMSWQPGLIASYSGVRESHQDDEGIEQAILAASGAVQATWQHVLELANRMGSEDAKRTVVRKLYCWVDMTPSVLADSRGGALNEAKVKMLSALHERGIVAWEAWVASGIQYRDAVLANLGMSLMALGIEGDAISRSGAGPSLVRFAGEMGVAAEGLNHVVTILEQNGVHYRPEGSTRTAGDAAVVTWNECRSRLEAIAMNIDDPREKAIARGLLARIEWVVMRRLRLQGISIE